VEPEKRNSYGYVVTAPALTKIIAIDEFTKYVRRNSFFNFSQPTSRKSLLNSEREKIAAFLLVFDLCFSFYHKGPAGAEITINVRPI
jgi:hypothetical protein